MIKQILNSIKSTTGRKEKEKILYDNRENSLLVDVIHATLNPRINYYIEKIPKYISNPNGSELEWGLTQLNKLSSRKLTGNNAINHLKEILECLSDDDASIIKLIIMRDLKCGIAAKTVNKIWKDLIPISSYCRCSLSKDMKNVNWKDGVYVQTKHDGMFVNITKNGSVEITTRNGNILPLEHFGNIAWGMENAPNGRLHGELLVYQDGIVLPRQEGNGVLNSVLKGGKFEDNQVPFLVAWDYITLDDLKNKKASKNYTKRFEELHGIIENTKYIEIVDTSIVYSKKELEDFYNKKLSEGEEGIIAKYPNFIWKDGTSTEQFKFKQDIPVELIVVGYNVGNGKNSDTFGSLICMSADGKINVSVSGFTDKERFDIWENIEYYIGKIITVKSNGIQYANTPHSLFLPQFVEWRLDKTEADTLEQIEAQFRIG